MNVPAAVIEHDMNGVRNSIHMCLDSIHNYEEAKKVKYSEQQELKVLIRNPGYYNVEALQRNVNACDRHIEEFEKVIEKEKESIQTYQKILKTLQEKLKIKKQEESENVNT